MYAIISKSSGYKQKDDYDVNTLVEKRYDEEDDDDPFAPIPETLEARLDKELNELADQGREIVSVIWRD